MLPCSAHKHHSTRIELKQEPTKLIYFHRHGNPVQDKNTHKYTQNVINSVMFLGTYVTFWPENFGWKRVIYFINLRLICGKYSVNVFLDETQYGSLWRTLIDFIKFHSCYRKRFSTASFSISHLQTINKINTQRKNMPYYFPISKKIVSKQRKLSGILFRCEKNRKHHIFMTSHNSSKHNYKNKD